MAEKGPITLPQNISDHCTVLVDDKIFIIGGFMNYSGTGKVLTISIHDGAMAFMTSMNESRMWHGCGSFEFENNTYIAVAGGNTNTSEIMNIDGNYWFQGSFDLKMISFVLMK